MPVEQFWLHYVSKTRQNCMICGLKLMQIYRNPVISGSSPVSKIQVFFLKQELMS